MQELSQNISGFYYDKQIENPLISVALYPNTIPPGPGGTDWSKVQDPDNETYINETEWRYSKTAIARAIINEDFNVSIANSWSDFGGDPISEIWNSQKPLAPYMLEAGKALSTIAEKTANYDFSNSALSMFSNGEGKDKFVKFFRKLSEHNIKQSGLLNRSLVVQGTRFSYYGGTGTDFGNLSMRYTIFAGYDKNGKWKSVFDQLKEVIPYCIGDFVNLDVDLPGELGSEVSKFINEFAQWQLPPGGFEAVMHDIDSVQKGTLKLVIGTFYVMTNLVLSNVQFNFSRLMTKKPDTWYKNELILEPLYCDVNLILKPATKYSKKSMMDFINGTSNSVARTEFQKKMADSLSLAESKLAEISKVKFNLSPKSLETTKVNKIKVPKLKLNF